MRKSKYAEEQARWRSASTRPGTTLWRDFSSEISGRRSSAGRSGSGDGVASSGTPDVAGKNRKLRGLSLTEPRQTIMQRRQRKGCAGLRRRRRGGARRNRPERRACRAVGRGARRRFAVAGPPSTVVSVAELATKRVSYGYQSCTCACGARADGERKLVTLYREEGPRVGRLRRRGGAVPSRAARRHIHVNSVAMASARQARGRSDHSSPRLDCHARVRGSCTASLSWRGRSTRSSDIGRARLPEVISFYNVRSSSRRARPLGLLNHVHSTSPPGNHRQCVHRELRRSLRRECFSTRSQYRRRRASSARA